MVKNIKALIKIESRSASLMGLYFLIINIGGLMFAGVTLNNQFKDYLYFGNANVVKDLYGDIFWPVIGILSGFIFLGLIILIYFQFKNDKSIETGRFLKSLPFTNTQKCFAKVFMGVLSYTLPFIILFIGFIGLRHYAMAQYGEIYRVLPYEEIVLTVNSVQNLMYLLFLNYMVYTSVYLFLFMMQYLINHNIGSLVIGVLSLLAPAFIIVSAHDMNDYARRIFNQLIDKVVLPLYGVAMKWGYFKHEGQVRTESFNYAYIDDIVLKTLVVTIVGITCIFVIWKTGKEAKIEDADILMPHGVVRWIFIVGVTICAAFLLMDMIWIFVAPMIQSDIKLILYGMALIGGVIGAVVAYRLAHLGILKKRRD